jgi:AraC-like DNA-binding protein
MQLSIETIDAAEQRASFRVRDSWSRSTMLALPSGLRLGVSVCRFEPTFAMPFEAPAAELEFVIARGAQMEARTAEGRAFRRGGNTLQLGRSLCGAPISVRQVDGHAPLECASLALTAARARELLGVRELPAAFRAVTESAAPYVVESRAITPRLARLLDELVHADVTGRARLVWYEGKCLELIALVTDEIADEECARAPLSTRDVDALERVRACLVARLVDPPTLAELARVAGVSETKLKIGFRIQFGTSVFAYLRQLRLDEARRLLFRHELGVTEVAHRVGYANPSKFAAAYRRQFGTAPSRR